MSARRNFARSRAAARAASEALSGRHREATSSECHERAIATITLFVNASDLDEELIQQQLHDLLGSLDRDSLGRVVLSATAAAAALMRAWTAASGGSTPSAALQRVALDLQGCGMSRCG